MARSKQLTLVLILAGIAVGGYLLRSFVPRTIAEYREAVEVAPLWGWVYLAIVAASVLATLALVAWGVSILWGNSRFKAQSRDVDARNPSQMSRAERRDAVETQLSEGRSLADDALLPADVREPIRRELAALEAKRQQQTLEIVAFGTISSGKSAVLNALAGRDAFRTDVRGGTTVSRSEVPWPDGDRVVLVDTPGLAEVDGRQREELAKMAARDADLVLFVADGPLKDFEHDFVCQLAAMEKPILVCVNKLDTFRVDDRNTLLGQIAEQTSTAIPRQNVVAVCARPLARVRTRVLPDGSQCEETVETEPDIGPLAERMRTLVLKEGQDLLLANLLLKSRGLVSDAKSRIRTQLDERASTIVDRAMWQAGAAAALSPFPILDVAAGMGITSKMVYDLAGVYRQRIDLDTASRLLGGLGKQLASMAGANLASPVAASAIASLLKTVPGAGTLSGGILQGLVQVLVTRWIGRTFMAYFRGEMQTPELSFASLARAQWDEVTRPEELAQLVKSGVAKLGGGSK